MLLIQTKNLMKSFVMMSINQLFSSVVLQAKIICFDNHKILSGNFWFVVHSACHLADRHWKLRGKKLTFSFDCVEQISLESILFAAWQACFFYIKSSCFEWSSCNSVIALWNHVWIFSRSFGLVEMTGDVIVHLKHLSNKEKGRRGRKKWRGKTRHNDNLYEIFFQ